MDSLSDNPEVSTLIHHPVGEWPTWAKVYIQHILQHSFLCKIYYIYMAGGDECLIDKVHFDDNRATERWVGWTD